MTVNIKDIKDFADSHLMRTCFLALLFAGRCFKVVMLSSFILCLMNKEMLDFAGGGC